MWVCLVHKIDYLTCFSHLGASTFQDGVIDRYSKSASVLREAIYRIHWHHHLISVVGTYVKNTTENY